MENKKLNKIIKILLLISGLLFTIFLVYRSTSLSKRHKVEVGQVYKYVENGDNPFEDDIIHYNLVLSVKGEFILYYDSALKDTLSERKSLFLEGSELVK